MPRSRFLAGFCCEKDLSGMEGYECGWWGRKKGCLERQPRFTTIIKRLLFIVVYLFVFDV
jgi:hypothetical protein